VIIKSARFNHDFYDGVITGDGVVSYRKSLSEIQQVYQQVPQTLSPDTLMYTVYSFDAQGDNTLLWGLTVMEPVLVAGECNMTRGHYHADQAQPEIYFGLAGEGLLLMMNHTGECWAEQVTKGSVHYIEGNYAHRLINTGDMQFKVGACWPKAAGHDYKAIDLQPFPVRVFKSANGIDFAEQGDNNEV